MGLSPLLDLVRGEPENENIVGADPVADFDVGAIQRADRQRAVQRELHVSGTGGFHTSGRYLFRQIGGRNDVLGKAHVVVGQESHLQTAADLGIGVDDVGDVVGKLDDQLGALV